MKIMKQKIFTLLVMVMVAMTASAEKGYKLTKGANPHGTTTIKVGDAEATTAEKGATVTIVVAPEEGHSIATVYGVLYTTWDGAKTRGMQVGDKIKAINLFHNDNSQWVPEIEDGGLSANFSVTNGEWICNVAGCYDLYLKIAYGQQSDYVYIGQGEDCSDGEIDNSLCIIASGKCGAEGDSSR